MGHAASYWYIGKDPALAFDTALPFGLNSRQQTAWMFDGGGMELMREFFKDYNIVNIPCGNTGTQMGGWFRKEIKSLDDLKGLKFRVGGFAGQVLARMGVVPQQIPPADIYPALEKGTIDATEWIGPYDDQKLGFNRVAKYYYYPGWWEGGPQLSIYVNAKHWASLPKEYQTILEDACAYAHAEMQAAYDAKNPTALKQLDRLRYPAASLPPRDDGGRLQDRHGALRGNRRQEPEVQEDLRALEEIPRRTAAVVCRGREPLRQLHAGRPHGQGPQVSPAASRPAGGRLRPPSARLPRPWTDLAFAQGSIGFS
jgi:hypothetical protein